MNTGLLFGLAALLFAVPALGQSRTTALPGCIEALPGPVSFPMRRAPALAVAAGGRGVCHRVWRSRGVSSTASLRPDPDPPPPPGQPCPHTLQANTLGHPPARRGGGGAALPGTRQLLQLVTPQHPCRPLLRLVPPPLRRRPPDHRLLPPHRTLNPVWC